MSSFDSITPPASTTTTSASLLDPPLQYDNHAQPFKYARASTLRLPHGDIRTPVFMPVGTKGTIKGISSTQLMDPALNPEIILGNTYHLALQVCLVYIQLVYQHLAYEPPKLCMHIYSLVQKH